LKHMGVPEDVLKAVAFLASNAAGFITGQRIAVNGGSGRFSEVRLFFHPGSLRKSRDDIGCFV
jgi:hypothetical protein